MRAVTVTVTHRPQMWANVVQNALRQDARPCLSVLAIHGAQSGWEEHTLALNDSGIPTLVRYVDASVTPGELTNIALTVAAQCEPEALLCAWDDDDWYGTEYLSTMLSTLSLKPDAWLLGRSGYSVRYIGGKAGVVDEDAGRIKDSAMHVGSLAGPTLCVPAKLWNVLPKLRYPHMGLGCDSQFFAVAYDLYYALGGTGAFPAYHVDAPFYLQRYFDPAHNHAWHRPQDRE